MALYKKQVVAYLKRQGYPHPDADLINEFMNAGEKQHQYDECVNNNYDLPDFERWLHLQKVLGIELPYKTAMAIDRALWEAELETMELNTPEDYRAKWEKEQAHVQSETPVFAKAIRDAIASEAKDHFIAFNFARIFNTENGLMCQFPGDVVQPLRSNICDIQDGDAFMIGTGVHTADGAAYQNFDEPDAPWQVVDIGGDVWYASDIRNAERSFRHLAKPTEKMFIFDGELEVQDENIQCVDGYLWATEMLVEKLRAQEDPALFASAESINFYSWFDLKELRIELNGTYWTFDQNDKEIQQSFVLPLSSQEQANLIAKMEAYCQKTYNVSCLDFLNQIRNENGLAPIASKAVLKEYAHATPPVNLHVYTVSYALNGEEKEFQFGKFSAEQPSADWIRENVETYMRHTHGPHLFVRAMASIDALSVTTTDAYGDEYIDSDELTGEDLADFFGIPAKESRSLDQMIQNASAQKEQQETLLMPQQERPQNR